jgi:hypothetical protein
MAAALFNSLAEPSRARAVSAGTDPAARVHPGAYAFEFGTHAETELAGVKAGWILGMPGQFGFGVCPELALLWLAMDRDIPGPAPVQMPHAAAPSSG